MHHEVTMPKIWFRKFIDPLYSQDVGPTLPQVVSLSGGRTSALMLDRILESGIVPIILFANTGKERDETLDFVERISETRKVKIIWVEYCRKQLTHDEIDCLKTDRMKKYWRAQGTGHWFKLVTHETAARHNQPGPFDELLAWASVLPNPRSRICTAELKVRSMLRYLWSLRIYKFVNYIGFRSDEVERALELVKSNRTPDVTFRFPLCEAKTTEQDVLDYWKGRPEDLQLEPYEGNCHLCFLKRADVKRRLIAEHPDKWQWWADQEVKKQHKGQGGVWRLDHTVKNLVLASRYNQYVSGQSMECSCTSGVSLGSFIDEEVDAEMARLTAKPKAVQIGRKISS